MPERNRPIQSYDIERVTDLLRSAVEHGPDSDEFFGQLALCLAEYDCDVLLASLSMVFVARYDDDPVGWADFVAASNEVIRQQRDEEERGGSII